MRVGPYEIGERIGAGATGTVFAAHRPDLELRVAIKQLAPGLATNAAFRERFRAEARVMARLDHPNCVRVIDLLEVDEGTFLVMEHVAGRSLRGLLDEHGRLSPTQLLGAVRGALLGLGHAHELGLVHRDIKPSNILCSLDGVSKLSDFGQVVDAGTTQRLGGTPAYMSPELISGSVVDPRSDLYSVGAVLYEAMEGRPPFVADDVAALLRLQLTAPPPPPRSIPQSLAGLVGRALAKDAGQRPQAVPEMLAELDAGAVAAYGPDWQRRAVFVVAGTAMGAAAGVSMAGTATAAPGSVVIGSSAVAGTAPAAPATTESGSRRSASRRRIVSPVVALALLAGAVGVSKAGAATGPVSGTTLAGVGFEGSGTAAASRTPPGPSDCAVANLRFSFAAVGNAASVSRASGQPLTIQVTASRSDVSLVGTVATAPAAGSSAVFAFLDVGVPPGGATWTASAIRLGGIPVDPALSRPVSVGVTCPRG